MQVAINSGSDVMTVRGPKEDVEKAMEIRAKSQHHKFLIGKAGIHIRKIMDDSGAR